MLDYAAVAAGTRSTRKEASVNSRASALREKEPSDPFTDNWGLVRAVPLPTQASRPRGGKQASSYSYTDPFEDYDVESLKSDKDSPPIYHDHDDPERGYVSLGDPPPRPYLHSVLHPATIDLTRLTPVTEVTSLDTLTQGTPSTETPSESSHTMPITPFGTTSGTSHTSHDTPRSPPRRPISFIDANTPPAVPMLRSNSWWARFSKTPLLDRRSSDVSRKSQPLDFRDPNPLPSRLNRIEEASMSPETPKRGSGHSQVYSTHFHGRSASSLQTSRTADSEMIEKMGRTMDIVRRASTRTTQSNSGNAEPIDTHQRRISIDTHSDLGSSLLEEDHLMVQSPEDLNAVHLASLPALIPSPPVPATIPAPPRTSPPSSPKRISPGGTVASRVQAIERRLSSPIEPPPVQSPAPARPRNRPSLYDVVPKPSLFIANPDKKRSSSGDS